MFVGWFGFFAHFNFCFITLNKREKQKMYFFCRFSYWPERWGSREQYHHLLHACRHDGKVCKLKREEANTSHRTLTAKQRRKRNDKHNILLCRNVTRSNIIRRRMTVKHLWICVPFLFGSLYVRVIMQQWNSTQLAAHSILFGPHENIDVALLWPTAESRKMWIANRMIRRYRCSRSVSHFCRFAVAFGVLRHGRRHLSTSANSNIVWLFAKEKIISKINLFNPLAHLFSSLVCNTHTAAISTHTHTRVPFVVCARTVMARATIFSLLLRSFRS